MRNLFFFFLMFCASVPGWCYKFDKSKYYCSEGGKIAFNFTIPDSGQSVLVSYSFYEIIDGSERNITPSGCWKSPDGVGNVFSKDYSWSNGTEIRIVVKKTTS